MAEVVNLRLRRKQAARAEARKAGAMNAARHGRTKAETTLTDARAEKAARDLEGHRRDSAGTAEAPQDAD
jgi:hypothetical protein